MIPAFRETTEVVIQSALLTHGQTATANIDTRGFEDVTIVLAGTLAGAGTAPTVVFKTSDTTATDTFVTAVATQLMIAGATGQLRYQLSKLGAKRYVRLEVTAPNGSTNSNVAPLVAFAIKGRPDTGGVSALDLTGSSSNTIVNV
jgi:type IV pilus biogenesis protein CpaD/CtpE